MSDPPHEQRGAARSHLPRRGRAKKRNGIPEDPRENSRLSNSSNKTNGHSSGVIFSNSKRLKSSRREVTSNRTNGSGSPSAAIISRNTENYQLASENMERRPHGQNEVSSSSSTARADHNTRSKNGVRKQAFASASTTKKAPSDISLDAHAELLASVDKRAHGRALLRDANAVLDNIVLPMSFPWAHGIEPAVKTIPHDIDEMYAIRNAANDLTGDVTASLHSEKMEMVRSNNVRSSYIFPEGTKVSSVRTDDPGVITLTRTFPPTEAQRCSVRYMPCKQNVDDVGLPGEMSLRMFEDIQRRKRSRDEMDALNLKKMNISFRVGSTSSRESIYPPEEEGKTILLLRARLPVIVQSGIPISKEEYARKKDRSLGSFDSGPSNMKRFSDRVRTGRTRLIWSETVPDESSHGVYRSILNSKIMEKSSHQRPRDVKVMLRVNGRPVSSQSVAMSSLSSARLSRNVFDKAVDDAVDGGQASVTGELQCYLTTETLVSDILRERVGKKSIPKAVLDIERPFAVSLKRGRSTGPVVQVHPPKLDVFPSEDGQLYTVCSERGSLSASEIESMRKRNDPSLCSLLEVTASDRNLCSVCWSPAAAASKHHRDDSLLRCDSCEIPVHRSCCGRYVRSANWKCDACLRYEEVCKIGDNVPKPPIRAYQQHRRRIECASCGMKGSSLSCIDGVWTHDVCRLWTQSQLVPSPLCCLCDTSMSPIIQCAAKNCQVMFHPLCALVASNAADLYRLNSVPFQGSSEKDRANWRDQFLCTQYRLARLEVGAGATKDSRFLSIAFCGYHNPDRSKDLKGLYPGGKFLRRAMRIPPQKSA